MNELRDRETIITLLDVLADADVCTKTINIMEEGDMEYDFPTKENYSYFRDAVKKLSEKCDFEVQSYVDEEDHSHNLSIRIRSIRGSKS